MGYLPLFIFLAFFGWLAGTLLSFSGTVFLTLLCALILAIMFWKTQEIAKLIPMIVLAIVLPFFVGLWLRVLVLEGVFAPVGAWISRVLLR